MGYMHFVGGEKGGVGKSLTARVLAQYFIDKKMPFAGFDLDHSHATFTRFYGEFATQLNARDFSSLDKIIEYAEDYPANNIVADLAAQTAQFIDKWIADSDIFSIFKELNYKVFMWHVMDDGFDSLDLLRKLLEKHQHPDIQLVVALNLGRGDDFTLFRESETYQELVKRSGRVFKLKKLETRLSQKIDINNSSFWSAANNREIMSIVERKRVATWLDHTHKQIDKLLLTEAQFQHAEGDKKEIS